MSVDLILASQSSRRAALLSQMGVSFTALSADIDESVLPGEEVSDYVERMAREKCRVGLGMSGGELPVLGADTCVVLDDAPLGKPADKMDALAMLARLNGREHTVLTGVCVINAEREDFALSSTKVKFLTLEREQLEAYIATGDPFDKAGAYGIQGLAGTFVERIEGSYSGVVGLPLAETWQLLRSFAIPTGLDPR